MNLEKANVNAVPNKTGIRNLSEEERFASVGLRIIPAKDMSTSFLDIGKQILAVVKNVMAANSYLEESLAGSLQNTSIAETTFNDMDISVNMESGGDQSDIISVDSISECSMVNFSFEDNSSHLSDSSLMQPTVETSYMGGLFQLVDKPKARRRLIF